MYATKFQDWGNSQGVRVPKPVLDQVGIAVGDSVIIAVQQDVITIRKSKAKKYPTLSELLAKIPKNYVHKHEDLFGKPVGKEVW